MTPDAWVLVFFVAMIWAGWLLAEMDARDE